MNGKETKQITSKTFGQLNFEMPELYAVVQNQSPNPDFPFRILRNYMAQRMQILLPSNCPGPSNLY